MIRQRRYWKVVTIGVAGVIFAVCLTGFGLDQGKHTASGSIRVTVVICPGWRPDPPPCPNISVSCPSKVESNGTMTFVATVAGGNPELTLTYKWSLSAGKIISGQGTPKITVDASGLSHNDSVTATVSVGGLDPACANVASCTTNHVRK